MSVPVFARQRVPRGACRACACAACPSARRPPATAPGGARRRWPCMRSSSRTICRARRAVGAREARSRRPSAGGCRRRRELRRGRRRARRPSCRRAPKRAPSALTQHLGVEVVRRQVGDRDQVADGGEASVASGSASAARRRRRPASGPRALRRSVIPRGLEQRRSRCAAARAGPVRAGAPVAPGSARRARRRGRGRGRSASLEPPRRRVEERLVADDRARRRA